MSNASSNKGSILDVESLIAEDPVSRDWLRSQFTEREFNKDWFKAYYSVFLKMKDWEMVSPILDLIKEDNEQMK